MDTLAKLFGSEAKVKIMRLFLFNPDQPFGANDIATRARVMPAVVRHEMTLMRKMGMVKGRRFTHMVSVKKGKKLVLKKKSEGGWVLNPAFPFLSALRTLLINTVLFNQNEVLRKLNTVGRIKMVAVAGVFLNDSDSRVDLLVVGDSLRFGALDNVIRNIESEIGKELRYSAFETADFEYRFGIYDKLVRDILEYPHRKILNKLGEPF